MRTLALLGLFAAMAFSQAAADPGLTRGVLLERDTAEGGEFSIRAPDYHVLRYRFDSKTSVEREGQGIDVPHLRAGDQVEVNSDAAGDQPLRYARSIRVTVAVPIPLAPRRLPPSRLRLSTAAEDRALPKGDLAFSGVIVRLDGMRLVLRTRTSGEQTILLRPDTRYLQNGALVAAAALKPAMRVFVRGGKNVYGDVEGYQVMWGEILEVR